MWRALSVGPRESSHSRSHYFASSTLSRQAAFSSISVPSDPAIYQDTTSNPEDVSIGLGRIYLGLGVECWRVSVHRPFLADPELLSFTSIPGCDRSRYSSSVELSNTYLLERKARRRK